MITVGHITKTFLPITQTFVYQQIMKNNEFNHLVFAKRRKNRKTFPHEAIIHYRNSESLIEQLQMTPVDILHAHFGPSGVVALPVKQKLNIPLITFFHGYDASKYPRTSQRKRKYQQLFLQGDCFAVPSKAIRKQLIKLGCPPAKIEVCYLGVEMEQFPYHPRLLDNGPIQLVSVGRLVKKKGHHVLIRAMESVKEEYPNVHLTIIGTGEQEEDLRNLCQQLGLETFVTFMGKQPHDVVKEVLKKGHIFCLASMSSEDGNMEGLPVAILEAQAMGLPVVTTNHSGIPEGVIAGKTALLAKEGDAQDLADKLLQMISRSNDWKEIGYAGRQWIRHRFDSIKQTHYLNQIYERLIDSC